MKMTLTVRPEALEGRTYLTYPVHASTGSARTGFFLKFRSFALILGIFFMLTTHGTVFAEPVPLQQVPPLPEGTALFKGEEAFAQRGRTGGFCMKPCKFGIYEDKMVHHSPNSQAIAVQYRKVEGLPFCGVYVVVLGDLAQYATLTFWIRGKKGREIFELGMNDTISNKREDAVFVGSIYRYLPRGVTTEWQQVKVPLEDFFGADLSRVYTLVFNFNEEGQGAFWVDDIQLDTQQLVDREDQILKTGQLLLDDFDHSDLNLLGRKTNVYKRLPSVCALGRVTDPRVGVQGRSLRLDFDKRTTGWCGYYTLLNQIDGTYFDLSAYKSATFSVRGLKGGESFEIGMADKSWLTIGDSVKAGPIEKYLSKGVTASWQEVVIPLADFGKLDWTQMGSFVINFYRPSSGSVFIDNLRFLRKTQEDLLKEWEKK